MDIPNLEASNEAIDAATKAQEAIEKAREVQMAIILKTILTEMFNIKDEGGNKRFIDVSQIPLICQNIDGIHTTLKEIKEDMVKRAEFTPVKTIVYGFVGMVLTAFIGGLIYLVFK